MWEIRIKKIWKIEIIVVSLIKLKNIIMKYLIIDCYGDDYEVNDLEKFVKEWYSGEISMEEGMVRIYEDCKVKELN